MPHIYLIGLGAVGAAYAAQAVDNGTPLLIICDPERKKRYEKSGFRVNGEDYAFNFITAEDDAPPADLILIAVKHHQLEEAIETIRPFIHSETIIFSLLNGIRSEETVSKKLQTKNVLPSIVVATDGQRNGNQITFSNKGKIIFGAFTEDQKALAEKAQSIMAGSGIVTENVPDMQYWFWWKFMTNVGINQTAALLRVPYGAYSQEGPARNIARKAMLEVVEIARKLGIPLTATDPEKTFRVVSTIGAENKSSTLQDIEAKRLTEVDLYAGEVIKLGKQLKIPTPVNELMYEAIKHFESEF